MTESRAMTDYVICLVLVLATLAVFGQVVVFDFSGYDDDAYVTENNYVQRGLTARGVVWAFTTTEACFWHPLVWLSYMLDHSLHGDRPLGYHLTNLLLHVANVLLLFAALNRMTGSPWRSGFVAALFALHPLHAESVAWAAQRKDVLSTFFWVLAMWAYARYTEDTRPGKYLLVLLFFLLGLMSKPMLVTLPLALILLDFWPLGRVSFGAAARHLRDEAHASKTSRASPAPLRVVVEKIPLLILALAAGIAACLAQKSGGALADLQVFPLGIRLANALVAYAGYLGKTVWPRDLAAFYPHPGDSLPAWQIAGAGLLLGTVTALVLMQARLRPYLAVGWLWFAGTLIPVSGLVQVGSHAMADRYTYVPLIGLFVIVAWGVPDLACSGSPKSEIRNPKFVRSSILPLASALVVIAFMVSAFLQAGYWRNGETLFRHALRVTSNSWLAHHNLGASLEERNRLEEAIAHYRRALEIRPDYPVARMNLANALAREGRFESALAEFGKASRGTGDDADVHYNLGAAFSARGRRDEAEVEYRKAIRIRPNHAQAHMNLGSLLGQKGENKKAIEHLTRAIEIKPDYAKAHFNLAVALSIQGEYGRAWEELRLSEKYGYPPDAAVRKFLAAKVGKE